MAVNTLGNEARSPHLFVRDIDAYIILFSEYVHFRVAVYDLNCDYDYDLEFWGVT